MKRTWLLAIGAAIGAAIMYLFDPEHGDRRRAVARDKLTTYTNTAREGLGNTMQQLQNRSSGTFAGLQNRLSGATPSDAALASRVRTELGRVVSHPGAVDITVQDGQVVLRGPILASEVDQAISSARLVPGVSGVVNQMDVHMTPDGVPGLQGAGSYQQG